LLRLLGRGRLALTIFAITQAEFECSRATLVERVSVIADGDGHVRSEERSYFGRTPLTLGLRHTIIFGFN
jgi:hypothetical protein